MGYRTITITFYNVYLFPKCHESLPSAFLSYPVQKQTNGYKNSTPAMQKGQGNK